VQQRAVEAVDHQAVGAQRALDRGIARLDRRLVATIPERGLGAMGVGERAQRLQAVALRAVQPVAAHAQRRVQCRQRARPPRIGRRAWRPVALFPWRMDEYRQDLVSARKRRLQRRIVVHSQVVAEPDQGGGHGCGRRQRVMEDAMANGFHDGSCTLSMVSDDLWALL